jgi:hypothetical protein
MTRRPERRFWHTLALALGATVEELQARMSSSEFSSWLAFYRLEPFGEVRADFRTGLLCATVANLVRDKHQAPHTPADFMPLAELELEEEPARPKTAKESQKEVIAAMRATLPST